MNESSIPGGIFGETPIVANAPVRSNPNNSSLEGGIFGAAIEKPPTPRAAVTKSSLDGGLFVMEAPVSRPGSARRSVTLSSVEGGARSSHPFFHSIFFLSCAALPLTLKLTPTHSALPLRAGIFGGYNYVEKPVSHAPAAKFDPTVPAGSANVKGAALSFDWAESTPLAPLSSPRANKNASSIAGGIFGAQPLPVKPAVVRSNPNASSIPGGIFG